MKRQQGGPEGILLVDKPAGWTSHDVVAKVRRLAGQRRIGHTGTLDPAATGVLVLCLGRATRLVEYLSGHTKAYHGEITLGSKTATDDAEGAVIETRPVPAVDDAALRRLETAFSGEIDQVPPAFSAIKVAGEKAYDAARKGRPLELAARRVRIDAIRLAAPVPGRLDIDVECAAGTYVRSLARDIGEALGCGAHLSSLRRTRVGHFDIVDAWTLPSLEAALADTAVEEILLPSDEGLLDVDAALVERAEPIRMVTPVVHGPRAVLRMYGPEGDFLGVASLNGAGELRPRKVFGETPPG